MKELLEEWKKKYPTSISTESELETSLWEASAIIDAPRRGDSHYNWNSYPGIREAERRHARLKEYDKKHYDV